jgi:putative glutamine amidotransferase
MAPPLIGITTYGRDENNRYSSPVEYAAAVRQAGGIPVLLPAGEPRAVELLARLDGLILAGGGDVDPALYQGKAHETIYNVDADRDRLEISLVKEAVDRDLPVLGICRGIQVINVALGGTLVEHLPDVVGEAVLHRTPPRVPAEHAVRVKAGSGLARILGVLEFTAASWHHQAIRRPAPHLEVVAHAPDGTIEGVEMPEHPWFFAVQWHPEFTAGKEPVQLRLFAALVEAAGRRTGTGTGTE